MRCLCAMALVFAAVLQGACLSWHVGGNSPAEQESMRLREEREQLQQSIGDMQQRLAALDKENEILRARVRGEIMRDVEIPMATSLNFDALSGVAPVREGEERKLRLYVQVLDQLGRKIPITGEATLTLCKVDANDTTRKESNTSVEHIWEGKELDQCYRSHFAGTHYTFVVPWPGEDGAWFATVEMIDHATGAVLTYERLFAP